MIIRKYRVERVKEEAKRYEIENESITSPKKMYEVLVKSMGLDKRTQETFCLMAYDTKLRLIGVFEVSIGVINATHVDMRAIFQRAFLCNAYAIAVAHNHPSGCPRPSAEDREVTARIRRASELLGIRFLDHIIVGEDSVYSFLEDHEL